MTHDTWIAFFTFASIVVAGGLGIASTITDTKDQRGKLTKWGKIALAGIILSNAFSFIQTFMEREKAAEERIASERKETQKAQEAYKQYLDQIEKLRIIVNKSDSSLKQQWDIQNQTSKVLTEMDQSLNVQNRIYKQSEVLTTQQKKVAQNIDRTLNPLLPFKVNLGLMVQADANSVRIAVLTKLLEERILEVTKETGGKQNINQMEPKEIEYLSKEGIFPIPATRRAYLIKQEFKYYSDLMNLFSNLDVAMSFSKNDNHKGKEIKCEVVKEYLQNRKNFPDVQLIYLPESQSYNFTFNDLPVRVDSDLTAGPYSIQDVEKSSFRLSIANSPGLIRESTIVFKFPPDFSRTNRISKTGTAYNTLSSYSYYTYAYKTQVNFFR